VELSGRKTIYSDVEEITADNVVKVIRQAFNEHLINRNAINYLYNYYKGKQPILSRTKSQRPDICNKVVENRANEIVSFKTGYLIGEPIQYVSRNGQEDIGEKVSMLNAYMDAESKPTKDKKLIEWSYICGTSYRLILPDAEAGEADEAPFEIYTLDPRNTFVIYSTSIGNKPIAGVYYTKDKNTNTCTFSVYTKDRYFVIKENKLAEEKPYTLGIIPIIEYPANNAKLGSFEIVITLLDAINTVSSNRVDGIEQFIQSLAVAVNCSFPEDTTLNDIKEAGMICLKSTGDNKADFTILSEQLNQSETQTLVDYMYQTVLTICGMPNRNGGSSTSDTGTAVVFRDGWSSAETRAKDSELMFKQSEQEALKLILRICRDLSDVELKISDITIKFTRRNYENIETKASVLATMLNNEKIAPKLAFTHCGMFTDAETAYRESMEWYEKNKAEAQAQAEAIAQANGNNADANANTNTNNNGKEDNQTNNKE